MQKATRLLHQFSATHSLLIGILPFFLPALLWKNNFSLAEISWFIAVCGISFSGTLFFWDRLRIHCGYRLLIILSFIAELILVTAIVGDTSLSMAYLIASLYGFYGCFFWMTQRLLLAECTTPQDTGRKFGNLQILMTLLLKVGILAGGFLSTMGGPGGIFQATLFLLIPVVIYCMKVENPIAASRFAQPFAIRKILAFRDRNGSRTTFFIDGFFLFAESYFWVISLYLTAQQDLARLGVLVVTLSLLLAGVFFVIKNTLDRIPHNHIYPLAVAAYAVSWLLRGVLGSGDDCQWTYPGITLIMFLTAFFRLVFNKRFFDRARQHPPVFYIVVKSYWSQTGLAVLFCIAGLMLINSDNSPAALSGFYYPLALLSLLFFRYR